VLWWHRSVRPGIGVAFTDTAAGNLAFSVGSPDQARANRRRLEQSLGLPPGELQFMTQVHGNQVARIQSGSYLPDSGPTADAMISRGRALAVLVADCVPVVLAGEGPDGSAVLAVAHAGRAGVASGVVPHTVEAMRAEGARHIAAWVGPSVCGHCYEVPAALQAEVAAVEPATAATTRRGTPSLDLPAGVLSQLDAAGVQADWVQTCTLEEPGLFSHRRDAGSGAEGRIAGVIYARS
jgi:YfiH family protein